MPVKNTIQAVKLASFNSADVTNDYQPIITNTPGLAHSCFLLRITNESNKDVTISFDGVTDNDYIFSATANNIPAIYPIQPNTNSAQFPQGQQIWLKGTTGTGTIYVAGYYQAQGG